MRCPIEPTARHRGRCAATFYHSFNRTAATQRTTIRLAFDWGRATLEGWIAALVERQARQDDYRLAIRVGIGNLVAAIVPAERLEVTALDGLRSLEIALRASPPVRGGQGRG